MDLLINKGLSERTIRQYMAYFDLLNRYLNGEFLTDETANSFVNNHPSNVTRAFLKNLLEFTGEDVKLIKKTGRKTKKKKVILSDNGLELLIRGMYAHDEVFGIMTELCYWCALRRQEVLDIEYEDLLLENWHEGEPCRLIVKGKGNKERFVIIPPHLIQKILKFVEKDYIKIDQTGRIFNVGLSTFANHLTDCKKALNIRMTGGLHDLRRKMATEWYGESKDLLSVQKRLGHSSVSTTQLYIQPDEEEEMKKWMDEY